LIDNCVEYCAFPVEDCGALKDALRRVLAALAALSEVRERSAANSPLFFVEDAPAFEVRLQRKHGLSHALLEQS
jgi:hypothetical protein